MTNIQCLHSHTKNSDGELGHLEVLSVCEHNNISVVAFTDHDTLISKETLQSLKEYRGSVKWISGIEISSGLPTELGGGVTPDLHIVGLFVDPTNEPLLKHCQLAQEARVSRMQKMVKNLNMLGFEITEESCLKASGGEAVGRPHIVSALNSFENNKVIIEKLRLDMERVSKENQKVKEKYDSMMESGERQYPYVLFLSDDAFIPDIYVDYQYFQDMDQSVKLIRNAGGVAILAHYFTCARKIDKNMLNDFFRMGRFDGAETVYGLFGLNTGSEIEKSITSTSKTIKEAVLKYKKLESGGADAHKGQDFVAFANSGSYAEKTEGLAEKIISGSSANKDFSNF